MREETDLIFWEHVQNQSFYPWVAQFYSTRNTKCLFFLHNKLELVHTYHFCILFSCKGCEYHICATFDHMEKHSVILPIILVCASCCCSVELKGILQDLPLPWYTLGTWDQWPMHARLLSSPPSPDLQSAQREGTRESVLADQQPTPFFLWLSALPLM